MNLNVVDLGTGTALIPIELCKRFADCRVMAADAAVNMLELARYTLTVENLTLHSFLGNALVWDHVDGYTARYVTVWNAGGYGMYAIASRHGASPTRVEE